MRLAVGWRLRTVELGHDGSWIGVELRLELRLPEVALERRPPRAVLWGGRPGYDFQVGSERDRVRAWRLANQARRARSMRRMEHAMCRCAVQFSDAFAPAVRSAERSMQALGRQMEESQRKLGGMTAGQAMADLRRAGVR